MGNNGFPEGKYMTTVKVGPKGQIVIPAEVREMFGIAPGDQLLLLADTEQGIALPPRRRPGRSLQPLRRQCRRERMTKHERH